MENSDTKTWKNHCMNVFSKSEREDDEEALKCVAMKRILTNACYRKSVETKEEEGKDFDTMQLKLTEKKALLERLVKIAEEDNEKFLLKLKERMDRVGLELPTIEVRFKDINVEAKVYVGSRALPTLLNFFVNVIEGCLNNLQIIPSPKKQLHILQNVSGIIKPKRMTLLLGPPGSGKTTLLLALAGRLGKDLKKSGRVTYNGEGLEEFVPQRTSAYVSQYDNHIGEMTVRETLAFSARCQGVGQNYEMLTELLRREKESNVEPDPDIDAYMKEAAIEGHQNSVVIDYILKILGLEVCADIMVGDQMIRGISGGEKKRLTTGEMLVGPIKVLFMDEISNGLDSSTTFQIINSIKQSIHILNGTALVSLLQPAPETYELFDDIILLTDGQIVYQGPRENVLEFFEAIGFKCPERKGVADFLQEVTSRKDQWQYWARKDEPYNFVTVKDFARAFELFHVGQQLGEEMADPFDKSKFHSNVLIKKKYGINKKELLRACASRELLLMKRNSFVYIFKATQLTYLATLTTMLFLRPTMHHSTIEDAETYMGALFFTVTVAMFNGISELNMAIMKLPIFYKQRDLLFYPSWAYSLPPWILKIPVTLIEVAIWECISYYGIGYDRDIGRFLKQYLVVLCINQMASALFRFMAALGRDIVVANTFGTFSLLSVTVLGGFVISRDDVSKWFLWGYWSSPLMYGQNAIAVNEFLGHSWRNVTSTNSNETLGVLILKSRGFFPQAYWYWIGVGALIGYVFLFNSLFALALHCLSPFRKDQAGLSQEKLQERNASTPEEFIQSQTQKSSSDTKMDEAVVENKASSTGRKGMVLPFQPLSLTFDDIKYFVDMPQGMKSQGVCEDRLELLKGVSGAFRPGVLTALMGVSGAGKTTLMDVLAGRKTSGYIEGNITISGYPKNQKTFARISGYCEQSDIHSPNVTVYESLLYSAWLRLSPEVDRTTRKMFIEEVMDLVELNSLRHALVGLPGENGLSTEQRKRLTIAVELVANPSIIFMDEPTSGLDARAAAIVMRTVRNTVDTGRTVVCTIHQPSIDIFDAFDELLLLKSGGEQIFAGPIGDHGSDLIQYFEAIQGVPMIKDGYNPATWMLEVTSAAKEANLKVNFTDVYKNSELHRRNKQLIQELSVSSQGSEDIYFNAQYSQTFVAQCIACLWKQHLSYWRNTSYTAVRLLFTIMTGVLFGLIFWDVGSKRRKEQDLFNAMGSMYAAVTFIGVVNGASVQPIVAIERSVFYRERAAGMYSALPYALAQVIIELPHILVQALVYGIIVYVMMGFERTVVKLLWNLFFTYFSFLYYTYYGMMTMAITPNPHVAGILSTSFYAIWCLFSGFIIPLSRIPIWWKWYYWICPVAWTLNGLVTSQYGDNMEILENGQRVEEFVRNYFGFKHGLLGEAAIFVVGFSVLFAFIFTFSIKAFNFQKR
ncbi:transcription factor [Trifolium repens]|nr:transcription factor [Trifolium repens]